MASIVITISKNPDSSSYNATESIEELHENFVIAQPSRENQPRKNHESAYDTFVVKAKQELAHLECPTWNTCPQTRNLVDSTPLRDQVAQHLRLRAVQIRSPLHLNNSEEATQNLFSKIKSLKTAIEYSDGSYQHLLSILAKFGWREVENIIFTEYRDKALFQRFVEKTMGVTIPQEKSEDIPEYASV